MDSSQQHKGKQARRRRAVAEGSREEAPRRRRREQDQRTRPQDGSSTRPQDGNQRTRARRASAEGRSQQGAERQSVGSDRRSQKDAPSRGAQEHRRAARRGTDTQGRATRPHEAQSRKAHGRNAQSRKPAGSPGRGTFGRRSSARKEDPRPRKLATYRRVGVLSAAAVLAAGAVVGLLFFARPTTSAVENRALTAKPTLTWSTFWSGEYFSDLALWYSDTYPVREQLVAANQTIESLHGIEAQTQMIGGTKQADELPPSGDKATSDTEDTDQADEPTGGASSKAKRERGEVEVPAAEVMAEAIQNQVLDGLYVKGDAAYNIYYFSQEAVQEYADAMNAAAESLDGEATVYSVVAPNASGILLSDQEVKDLGGTNQVDAIEYFYSLYDDAVHPVDAVPKLQEHDDEYIFYRTDHHWTALGAYYAYVAFCEEKGIEPEELDELEYMNLGDFLGSFYSQLSSAQMAANPDYVEAWIPNATNEMTLWDQDGTVSTDYNIITDTSEWDITGKTMAFIMGDQPLQKIENPKLSDGSSCLLIKDSFGDFFAPWLVDHYQTVYVGDFRYFESNIDDFVRENDVDDLIFCNNVTLAGGGVVGPAILGRLTL